MRRMLKVLLILGFKQWTYNNKSQNDILGKASWALNAVGNSEAGLNEGVD